MTMPCRVNLQVAWIEVHPEQLRRMDYFCSFLAGMKYRQMKLKHSRDHLERIELAVLAKDIEATHSAGWGFPRGTSDSQKFEAVVRVFDTINEKFKSVEERAEGPGIILYHDGRYRAAAACVLAKLVYNEFQSGVFYRTALVTSNFEL